MSPALIWLTFVFISLIGVIGYDYAYKISVDKVDPYSFTALLAGVAFLVHIVMLAIYKYFQPAADVKMGSGYAGMAVLAGVAVVMIDFGLFIAIKHGGLVKTNTVWLVGGLVLTVMMGVLIFKEAMTYERMLGIVLGVAAMALMVKE